MVIEPQFTGELVIGRFYRVPTVRGRFFSKITDWPVLGPMHEDKEFINFPQMHYHFDFRFFNRVEWEFIVRMADPLTPFSYPLIARPDYLELGPVTYRRRRYQRVMPGIPKAKWLRRLEAAYANQVLKPGLVCPHRGASLRGLPVDAEGCVVCPLHGLKWNVTTGKLVPEGSFNEQTYL